MIKVFTTFSGYDSQCLALKYAGIPFELVGWSEIDKYAITAHNALFPEYADRNLGDITKVDWNTVPDFDMLTYSSPCQDISNAGMQRGLEKGSGTRSSLLWEVEKAIEAKRPKYLLMENVKALVGKKFKADFEAWLKTLESYGYQNFWKVLNAKDYGVPQNRERVFVVSSLDASEFYFPPTIRLDKRLLDVLEDAVDERYYLNDERIKAMIEHCERKQSEGCGIKFEPKDGEGIANSVTTHSGSRETDNYIKTKCLNSKVNGKQPSLEYRVYDTDGIATALTTCFLPSIKVVGKWSPSSQSNGNVYDAEGIAPTIVCGAHGGCEPRIIEKKADVRNTAIAEMIVSEEIPTDKVTMFDTRHRTVSENSLCLTCQTDKCAQQFVCTPINTDAEGNARTINCHYPCMNMDSVTRKSETGYGYVRTAVKSSFTSSIGTDFRIRKLTEREFFRLMGVREYDIDKLLKAGISKTQLYKLAGNSIVCDVLMAIFDKMFVNTNAEKGQQLSLF